MPSPNLIARRSVCKAVAALLFAAAVVHAAVPEFCFLHTSDTHLYPRPIGSPIDKEGAPAIEGLHWLCTEAGKPQLIEPLHITTPPPAFIIDTGDVTEYGAIGETWPGFESIIKPLSIPFYVSPGNHDNTWSATLPFIRQRYGADHYSFNKFGCHFACIDTATPSEPICTIDQRTLTWLAADLAGVDHNTPVFLFAHHPLTTEEFAKPYDELRLLQLLEPHNVVLYMMGHGHGHRHERWNQLDSVMGGSTSHPEVNLGYNIVLVQGGVLRVAFRPRDATKPMQITLEKPIDRAAGPEIRFANPVETRVSPAVVTDAALPVVMRVSDSPSAQANATIDNAKSPVASLKRTASGLYEGTLPTRDLLPGVHYVLTRTKCDQGEYDRATSFLYQPPGSPSASRTQLTAGVKARPLPVGEDLIVVTTAGAVLKLSPSADSMSQWQRSPLFDAGVEILHPPVLADGMLFFSAAEKGVHCLALDGKLKWACKVGATVYGTPAVDERRVYAADMEGGVHAINRETGTLAWSKHHATFGIEMPILLQKGLLIFGAWDAQVYAVRATDGSLAWKKPGPAGHREKPLYKSRYYAPADCPAVVVGDRLFVTDRAYVLGSYKLETGEYLGEVATDVAAIGPTQDGQGFYARGLAEGLTRYDKDGKAVWSVRDLPMGRFPAPPTESAGRVSVCSNRGTLSVHDAADGRILMRYQATPQLYVMAPTAVNARGEICVAGMDGSITCVRAADRK